MSQIINSPYVPLQPPYPIIYCNGEVGMQIATLIVLEKPDIQELYPFGNKSAYYIISHSHPVVSYGNKQTAIVDPNVEPNDWSEGIVWEHVELRDVMTLCHAPNGVPNDPATENVLGNSHWVHFSANQNLSHRLGSLVPQERWRNLFGGQSSFSLTKLAHSLSRLVPADFSMINEEPRGSLYLLKGGLRPGENSITSNHIMNLPCFFIAIKQEKTLDANVEAVKIQVEDYLNAVSANRNKVHIEFKCRDEELQPLIDRLNAEYCKPIL